jgi:hypothetical protein
MGRLLELLLGTTALSFSPLWSSQRDREALAAIRSLHAVGSARSERSRALALDPMSRL